MKSKGLLLLGVIVALVIAVIFVFTNVQLSPGFEEDTEEKAVPYLPDLTVESLDLISIKNLSNSTSQIWEVEVNFTIKNIGTASANETGWEARLFHAGYPTIGWGFAYPEPIAPGQSSSSILKSRLYNPGEYVLNAEVDPDNVVEEINENNNDKSLTFVLG